MNARRIGTGIIAGLVGGIAFGLMMQMMGMMGMVAGLAGQSSAAVGWVVHLAISAVIGAGYGLTFGQLHHSWGRSVAFGMLYGAVWWVLGPLLVMPMMMGMPVGQVGAMQIQSLVGHLVFGAVTGLVFTALVRRAAQEPAYSR